MLLRQAGGDSVSPNTGGPSKRGCRAISASPAWPTLSFVRPGTDALLTTALILAGESPEMAITAILPVQSETGTGVPLAAACRRFEPGAAMGAPWLDHDVTTVEVPLRRADGAPRSDDEVNAAFKAAAHAVVGRAIVYLTYSTKTGLIAPTEPPLGVDVVVDACQARVDPARMAGFLQRGWPVVVTGSKFFGGPAFSGAVLFPRARIQTARRVQRTVNIGTVLRWTAAREAMEAFATHAGGHAAFVQQRIAAIDGRIAACPMLVPVAGLLQRQSGHWSDGPSIVSFAVRAPGNHKAMLSASALRPIYERVAQAGVLLGQPVDLGPFGGLRIAIGARDLLAGDPGHGLQRLFTAIEGAIHPASKQAVQPSSLWQPGPLLQRPPARVG